MQILFKQYKIFPIILLFLTGNIYAQNLETFVEYGAAIPVSYTHLDVYKRQVLGGEYIGKNVEGTSIHFQSVGRNNDKSDSVKIGAGAGAEWILY